MAYWCLLVFTPSFFPFYRQGCDIVNPWVGCPHFSDEDRDLLAGWTGRLNRRSQPPYPSLLTVSCSSVGPADNARTVPSAAAVNTALLVAVSIQRPVQHCPPQSAQ